MKLLAPQDIKTDKTNTVARDLLRAQEMQKETERIRREMLKAEADFKDLLAKNAEQLAKEEAEHNAIVKIRTTEVETLENRKRVAMEPISDIRKRLDKDSQEVADLKIKLDDQEDLVEDLKDRLEAKLDQLGQQEADLTQKSAKLEAQRLGVEEQAEQVKEGVKSLNLSYSEFLANTKKVSEEVGKKKTELSLYETNLLVRDDQLKEKTLSLKTWAKNIKQAELEVEEKKKELLRPIADIIAEAKTDRELAASEKIQAQTDRQQAQVLKKQAKLDYDHLLSQLNVRDEELSKEENLLQKLKSDNITKSQNLNTRDLELKAKEDDFVKEKGKLAAEWEASQTYLAERELEVKNMLELAESKELAVATQVKESLSVKAQAEKLFSEAKVKETNYRNMWSRVKEERRKILTETEGLVVAKQEAEQALAELTAERQNFALWRTDAEKYVTNVSIETKALKKVLAQREEKLKRQEKFLANWEKKLKDDEGRLARAWKELKNNIPKQ